MYDNVITLVRNTPVIWDKKHKHHRDEEVVSAEWKKIASQMGRTETNARTEWEDLRKRFDSLLRKSNGRSYSALEGSGNTWLYFNQMLFLADQYPLNKIDSSFTPSNRAMSPDRLRKKTIAPQSEQAQVYATRDPISEDPSSSPCIASCSGNNTTNSHYKSHTSEDEIGEQLLHSETEKPARKNNIAPYDHTDEDVCFFYFLLPHVMKLSPKDKFIFRMKVQQVLFELKFLKEQQSAQAETS